MCPLSDAMQYDEMEYDEDSEPEMPIYNRAELIERYQVNDGHLHVLGAYRIF